MGYGTSNELQKPYFEELRAQLAKERGAQPVIRLKN
jgi:hypothetical protein